MGGQNFEKYTEYEPFRDSIRDAKFDYWIHNLKESSWSLSQLDVGRIHVQYGIEGAGSIADGFTRTDGWAFFFQRTGHARGNGRNLPKNAVLLIAPGDRFCLSAEDAHEWFSAFVPNGLLADSAERFKTLAATGSDSRIVGLSIEQGQRVDEFTEQLVEGQPEQAACRQEGLVAMGQELLMQPAVYHQRRGRRPATRCEIVSNLLDHIESAPQMNPTMAELADVTGVSERTVRSAINEYFGVSPNSFIILRRLHEVRRQLRELVAPSTTVATAANQFGFKDAGRFAEKYRNVFGENPSATLRRHTA